MTAFRLLLSAMLIAIIAYTAITIANHGWNLFPVFFGDIARMAWPGQFNFDFLNFLILSGLWVSWRNRFSLPGIALGLVALCGGMLFLSAYLLVTSIRCGGDMEKVLLGARYQRA